MDGFDRDDAAQFAYIHELDTFADFAVAKLIAVRNVKTLPGAAKEQCGQYERWSGSPFPTSINAMR